MLPRMCYADACGKQKEISYVKTFYLYSQTGPFAVLVIFNILVKLFTINHIIINY